MYLKKMKIFLRMQELHEFRINGYLPVKKYFLTVAAPRASRLEVMMKNTTKSLFSKKSCEKQRKNPVIKREILDSRMREMMDYCRLEFRELSF